MLQVSDSSASESSGFVGSVQVPTLTLCSPTHAPAAKCLPSRQSHALAWELLADSADMG